VKTKFTEVGAIYIHEVELDSNDIVSLTNNETGKAYSLSNVATVEANKKLYSKRQA
jgi:hypothetical protein